MPNDYSASLLDKAKILQEDIYRTNATTNRVLSNTPVTVASVMEKQTANVSPIMNGAGNECVGVTVFYPEMDDQTVGGVSSTPLVSDCEIPDGDTYSTASKDYDLNVFKDQFFTINDKDCDNEFKFAERVAFGLSTTLHKMALSLNNHMISVLDTNKSTPTVTNLPDNVTIVGGEYTITGAQFWTGIEAAQIIPVLDQLALINGLPDNYYIISGKSLQIAYNYSRDRALNDNERSYTQTFQGRDITFDPKNVDPIIAEDAIYLVDPNVWACYFHQEYSEDMVQTDDENNTITHAIPLDFFSQYQNGDNMRQTLQYMNELQPQNVMVNISYQKKCNTTSNKYGFRTHNHKWELKLAGLIDLIPRTDDFGTGIIRVNKAI